MAKNLETFVHDYKEMDSVINEYAQAYRDGDISFRQKENSLKMRTLYQLDQAEQDDRRKKEQLNRNVSSAHQRLSQFIQRADTAIQCIPEEELSAYKAKRDERIRKEKEAAEAKERAEREAAERAAQQVQETREAVADAVANQPVDNAGAQATSGAQDSAQAEPETRPNLTINLPTQDEQTVPLGENTLVSSTTEETSVDTPKVNNIVIGGDSSWARSRHTSQRVYESEGEDSCRPVSVTSTIAGLSEGDAPGGITAAEMLAAADSDTPITPGNFNMAMQNAASIVDMSNGTSAGEAATTQNADTPITPANPMSAGELANAPDGVLPTAPEGGVPAVSTPQARRTDEAAARLNELANDIANSCSVLTSASESGPKFIRAIKRKSQQNEREAVLEDILTKREEMDKIIQKNATDVADAAEDVKRNIDSETATSVRNLSTANAAESQQIETQRHTYFTQLKALLIDGLERAMNCDTYAHIGNGFSEYKIAYMKSADNAIPSPMTATQLYLGFANQNASATDDGTLATCLRKLFGDSVYTGNSLLVPITVGKAPESPIVVKYGSASENYVNALLSNYTTQMMNLMSDSPVNVFIGDERHRGSHFPDFWLYDKDEDSHHVKVMKTRDSIASVIEELSDQVVKVATKTLRGEYSDVFAYNASPQTTKKLPINIIMLPHLEDIDDDDTVYRLLTIANQGSRCGFFILGGFAATSANEENDGANTPMLNSMTEFLEGADTFECGNDGEFYLDNRSIVFVEPPKMDSAVVQSIIANGGGNGLESNTPSTNVLADAAEETNCIADVPTEDEVPTDGNGISEDTLDEIIAAADASVSPIPEPSNGTKLAEAIEAAIAEKNIEQEDDIPDADAVPITPDTFTGKLSAAAAAEMSGGE